MNEQRCGWVAVWLVLVVGALSASADAAPERPNILWIVVEDMSPHFSCYGETTIRTPNVDALAMGGTLFRRAFVTAPVCSAARSALITGMWQTSIGAHHHRSGRGELKIRLPSPVRLVPELLREAGYWTSNGELGDRGVDRLRRGKTDYNFEWSAPAYDGSDWKGRAPGQPFFAQVQLRGGKLRDGAGLERPWRDALGDPTPPEAVRLPPYYPDDPVIRADWAAYLDAVRQTDREVGEIVDRLRREGVLEDTVIVFTTDHGISHARGKQFLYEEGTHVPLILAGPGQVAGAVREDLVAHIDIAAETLRLAGLEVPRWMEARPLGGAREPRAFVVSARDRCDETVDRIRSVRTQRWRYIRNFYPARPHLQPNAYKDHKPTYGAIRRLEAAGELEGPALLLVAPTRPPEELYDLEADPWQVSNLAGAPQHAETLARLRGTLDGWIEASGDHGRSPESREMFASDMKVYVEGIRRRQPERAAEIERNIDLMSRWAEAGR